ncbi:MAG TPA: hypothetical protein VFJ58_02265, partial [Armatimonadota bacterium]|nr:hypothetical protein [Armatimonadota bacterium]
HRVLYGPAALSALGAWMAEEGLPGFVRTFRADRLSTPDAAAAKIELGMAATARKPADLVVARAKLRVPEGLIRLVKRSHPIMLNQPLFGIRLAIRMVLQRQAAIIPFQLRRG